MKFFVIFSIVTILVLVSIFALFSKSQTTLSPSLTSTPTPPAEDKINFTASFTIITDNITRSFKAEKYHNLSLDVYITVGDPTLIHVKKSGITWDDFFKTLPMKLTKDCLTTGDGENLCNGKGALKFYLNNTETPDLLEKPIKESDKILINFIST